MLVKIALLSTHKNILVLGSGGPQKPDRYSFYLQSLGRCEIVSCVSELIISFIVAFRVFLYLRIYVTSSLLHSEQVKNDNQWKVIEGYVIQRTAIFSQQVEHRDKRSYAHRQGESYSHQ
jgi:hypothetical protein